MARAKEALFSRTPALTLLNSSLSSHHKVYLWRHNGACQNARDKHYEYFMLENWTQTTCVLIQDSHWIIRYVRLVIQFRIEPSNIFQIVVYFQTWNISFANQCLTVWGNATASPTIEENFNFFFHLFVDYSIGANCDHKDFIGRILLGGIFIDPTKHLLGGKYFWSVAALRMFREVQLIKSLENPGILTCCNGRWQVWPETLVNAPKCEISCWIWWHRLKRQADGRWHDKLEINNCNTG